MPVQKNDVIDKHTSINRAISDSKQKFVHSLSRVIQSYCGWWQCGWVPIPMSWQTIEYPVTCLFIMNSWSRWILFHDLGRSLRKTESARRNSAQVSAVSSRACERSEPKIEWAESERWAGVRKNDGRERSQKQERHGTGTHNAADERTKLAAQISPKGDMQP